MSEVRRLDFPAGQRFPRYVDWQQHYMDQGNGVLIPNTEIWQGGILTQRVNALGCRGFDLAPGAPVIGYFGDSTTFCAGLPGEAWPERVNIGSCQALNAAVEGYNMTGMVRRYRELRDIVPMAAIVVYAGWHNIIYNETTESEWSALLNQFDGPHVTAFCTMATCLTTECVDRGLTDLIKQGPETHSDDVFLFWGSLEPTLENIRRVHDGVMRYNVFIRDYCRERGAVLVDFYDAMRSPSYEAVTQKFYDVCHARPRFYPLMAAAVDRALSMPVQHYLARHPDCIYRGPGRWFESGRDGTPSVTSSAEPGRNNVGAHDQVYPLW